MFRVNDMLRDIEELNEPRNIYPRAAFPSCTHSVNQDETKLRGILLFQLVSQNRGVWKILLEQPSELPDRFFLQELGPKTS